MFHYCMNIDYRIFHECFNVVTIVYGLFSFKLYNLQDKVICIKWTQCFHFECTGFKLRIIPKVWSKLGMVESLSFPCFSKPVIPVKINSNIYVMKSTFPVRPFCSANDLLKEGHFSDIMDGVVVCLLSVNFFIGVFQCPFRPPQACLLFTALMVE